MEDMFGRANPKPAPRLRRGRHAQDGTAETARLERLRALRPIVRVARRLRVASRRVDAATLAYLTNIPVYAEISIPPTLGADRGGTSGARTRRAWRCVPLEKRRERQALDVAIETDRLRVVADPKAQAHVLIEGELTT